LVIYMSTMNTYNNKKILITTLINLLFMVSIFALTTENAMAQESEAERYALIEQATGEVVNVILLAPGANWAPPAGHIVIPAEHVNMGQIWNGSEFTEASSEEQEQDSSAIQADIAEYIEAAEESLLPGDLVAVAEKGVSVRKSNKAYDKNIVGVVSLEPGLLLGRNESGTAVPLALAGRVKVKVSNENGPIAAGDAITSSSKPGVGMKATKPGRVIGIALESYDIEADVAGTIFILINPHWQGNDLSVEQDSSGQLVNLDKEQLRQGLATLGLTVNQDGILEVGEVKTQRIEVKNPYGITIYDTVTGQPQCVISQNGQLRAVAGKCEGLVANVQVQDTTAPIISLVGLSLLEVAKGAAYVDEGATASDDIDGDITANIVVVNPVDTATLGTYQVTYNVSDTALNAAVEVTRTVNVVEVTSSDTTAPVITLLGDASVELEVGEAYTDAGATAADDVDGDLTFKIVVVNPVDTNTEGSYIITYNVSDSAGNQAAEVIRTVNVVPVPEPADITAPVITLLGQAVIELVVGDVYTDEGATATDDVDGDLTTSIVVDNPVDTTTPGTYTVTYTVSDAAGNLATPITRTINVVEPAPEPTP